MAQFRTTADIINEVLQKSGESTTGSSPYQTRALTYLNKAHHAIIGGGSILNVNVDEPWVWARSHFPMVIELQPAFTSGFATVLNGSNNITFQTASSVSLEGWHFQVSGKATVYKIMNHTAAGTTAQLDSSFVDNPGVYNFRAFKLDYPIFSTYMYIDSSNDTLDFSEGTAATISMQLQHGSFTPSNLLTTIVTQMISVGTQAYGGSYDSVAQTFNVTGAGNFAMLGATGTNTRRSVLPLLGFDMLDQTGAKTYTGVYQPNQVARLIEPFKTFMTNWSKDHFCYSTDPIKMQEDYPLDRVTERFPDRFCRISEDNNGVIWVRFNAYPVQLTKLQVDWVPQPIDLQNNTASFTKLPRGDVDTLIHGAAAMLLFDKEDSKYQGILKFCSDGLDAMKKKNHDLLFRTGHDFGQIVPRQDLNKLNRRLNYGYTVNGSTASGTTAQSTQAMLTSVLTYLNFSSGQTTSSVIATTLANNMTLFALIVKHSQVFTGPSVTALKLDVGTLGNPTQFINGFNMQQATAATAQSSALVLYFPAVSTPLYARVTATGANTSNLTAGSVTLYFQETITQ